MAYSASTMNKAGIKDFKGRQALKKDIERAAELQAQREAARLEAQRRQQAEQERSGEGGHERLKFCQGAPLTGSSGCQW